MRLQLPLIALLSVILFTSCNSSFGKKVKVNDRIEVYIKNEATEEDAKKMGNYFANTWKEQTNEISFQLSKDSAQYTVKMVVDEKKLKADSTLDVSFLAIQALLEQEVFKGSKVKLILTDNKFNDIKTFDSSPPNTHGEQNLGDSTKSN